MLPANHAKVAVKILAFLLVAAISFFYATSLIPKTDFVKDSLESVEESNQTVLAFSAATLSASLAITALPDDFGTTLADSLADMNVYFIAILVVLLLEKILIIYGIKLTFAYLIPCSCIAAAIGAAPKKNFLQSFAVRLCILGLTLAFVVPCSTHLTKYVAADLTAYVEETIAETEDGAGKLNTAMETDDEERNMFEKLSELFQTAIRDISDLLLHFRNNIRRCMNSIAILILTNFIMPVLTFFFLKWVLNETFHIVIPTSDLKQSDKRRRERKAEGALIAIGGDPDDE
jgi:hypothetical protein